MVRIVFVLAAILGLPGCFSSPRVRDTPTVHNPEASRIWIVRHFPDSGEEFVVMCDVARLHETPPKPLCQSWPPKATAE